jgi:DUF4097 and DUF4098 domain-containing protein YvlB
MLGYVLILVSCVACWSPAKWKYEESIEKTISFKPGSKLVVDNSMGSITVKSHGRDVMLLEMVKKVKARSKGRAEDRFEEIKIEIDTSRSDMVRIKTRHPKRWRYKEGVSVNFTIYVPTKTELSLDTGMGSISVDGIDGRQVLDTGMGSIEVKEAPGDLKLHTGMGSIKVREATGSLDLDTGMGEIDIDITRKVEDDIYAHTGMGSITLELPEDTDAEISASTGMGKVSSNLPITVRGTLTGSSLKGELGKGGPTIKLSTGMGGIKLRGRG